jgi:hypothetical protein
MTAYHLGDETPSSSGFASSSIRFRFLNADLARERQRNKRFSSRYQPQFLPRI